MKSSLRDIHHIFKTENSNILKGGPRTIRELSVEPRSCIETLKLGKSELVNCVHLPTRKHLGNVGGTTKIVVVDRNQDAIFGSLKVKFQVVDAHLTRQQDGRPGFLRG